MTHRRAHHRRHDNQCQGQRNLHGNKDPLNNRVLSSGSVLCRTAQRRLDRNMARQPSRSQSEQQRAHHRTTAGNSQRRKIRPHRQSCCGFPVGEELQQVAVGHPREQDRQRASAECEQNRLDEQLLHQPRARRAQRAANRKFMLPCGRPRHAQSGKIHAADQQHHPDQNLQQKQRPLILRAEKAPAIAAGARRKARPLDHLRGGVPPAAASRRSPRGTVTAFPPMPSSG